MWNMLHVGLSNENFVLVNISAESFRQIISQQNQDTLGYRKKYYVCNSKSVVGLTTRINPRRKFRSPTARFVARNLKYNESLREMIFQ